MKAIHVRAGSRWAMHERAEAAPEPNPQPWGIETDRKAMKLYVANLPYSATEEDIRTWFGEMNITAEDISVIRDRETQRSRGFAFVTVSDQVDPASLHGLPMEGRRLTINEARPRPERLERH